MVLQVSVLLGLIVGDEVGALQRWSSCYYPVSITLVRAVDIIVSCMNETLPRRGIRYYIPFPWHNTARKKITPRLV